MLFTTALLIKTFELNFMHIYVGEQLTEDDNNDNNKAKDKSLLHRPILTESNEPIAENVLLPAISEIRYSLNRNF